MIIAKLIILLFVISCFYCAYKSRLEYLYMNEVDYERYYNMNNPMFRAYSGISAEYAQTQKKEIINKYDEFKRQKKYTFNDYIKKISIIDIVVFIMASIFLFFLF